MQTEFSVYVLLRLWLYLKFHQGWEGNPQDAVLKSHKYFQVSHQVRFELKVMPEFFTKNLLIQFDSLNGTLIRSFSVL